MKASRRQSLPAAAAPAPEPTIAGAALIFGIALAVRLFHIVQIRRSPFFSVLMGDARGYDQWAQRLAAGDWIGTDVFYQAPLYPYFLGVIYALLGRDLLIIRIVQALVGSAACVLVGLAAWRLFSKPAGLVAGIGLALYAPAIFFDGLIQKSVLDVFFISLTLWLLARIVRRADLSGPPYAAPERRSLRSFVWLGLAMGALALTRENALVLVAVVFAWMLMIRLTPDAPDTRRRATVVSGFSPTASMAAAFGLGLALVLAPVAIRNYAVGGRFYLTTSQFGPNLFIGNNARADGTYASLRAGRGSPEYERQDATELAERALGRRLAPGEVSAYWTDAAMAFITSRPGAWLKLLGRKFMLLLNADEMLDTESQESYAEWSLPLRALGWLTHFGVLVPLAVLGVWATWPDRRRLAIFYALVIAYAASVVLFYVFARYRFPLVPMLMLFAAPGVICVGRVRRTRPAPTRPTRAAVAAVIAAIVLCNWPMLEPSLMQAITENNLAAALQEDGRPDDAIAQLERAIARRPDYAPAYSNLGVALRAKGRIDDAIGAYQKALALRPDNPDTHYNLANALLEKDRPAEAAEHFKLAGRAAPPSANVENNLGIALAADGKLQDAAAAFGRALQLDPNAARVHRNLGDALVSLGQTEEGIDHLRRATELEPSNATFHYDFAVVLLDQGRLPEARNELDAALRLDPQFAPAHNNLGVVLGSEGNLDAAIDHFERALAIDPTYEDARRNLDFARRARDRMRGSR